jgi:hypothetical protein
MNSNTKIGKFFAWAAILLLPLTLLPAPSAIAQQAQQPVGVSGSGEVFQGVRRVSFTAVRLPNTTATGTAIIRNTETHDIIMIDITCIAIIDENTIILGGVITRATNQDLVGQQVVFAVRDLGSQDFVSPLFTTNPEFPNPCFSPEAERALIALASSSSVVDKGEVTVRIPFEL